MFHRCLKVSYVSVAKSAPLSLISSLILAALTVTRVTTSLRTATALHSRTMLSSSNHSNSNNLSRSSSNRVTRRKSWPTAPQAPPLPRGLAMPMRDRQTVITAGGARTKTPTGSLSGAKVTDMCVRRSINAACAPGHSSQSLSSMCTSWGTWGWNLTSVNTAVRPSVIPATSGCTSRFTQVRDHLPSTASLHFQLLKSFFLVFIGQKNYKCSICDKLFTQKSHVASHMLIHTGAEKLKCDLCDRAFIRKHDLKQHMFSHTQYVPASAKLFLVSPISLTAILINSSHIILAFQWTTNTVSKVQQTLPQDQPPEEAHELSRGPQRLCLWEMPQSISHQVSPHPSPQNLQRAKGGENIEEGAGRRGWRRGRWWEAQNERRGQTHWQQWGLRVGCWRI